MDDKRKNELTLMFRSRTGNDDLDCALANMTNMVLSLQKDLDQTQRKLNEMTAYIVSWTVLE
tara:strand:+ start:536 stop:721 length:186 start_codon:yes stop_codon:yes gene_type:complete